MITQIYSIQTAEEAIACVEAGVDRIGVAIDTGIRLPAQVNEEKCREIFTAVGDKVVKVLIAVTKTGEDVYGPLSRLRPDVIHICGNEFFATPEFVARAKKICPGVEVLQAIPMTGPKAIDEAVHFAEFCDMIILDSVDPKIAGIGAAGVTHDWALDAAIVRKVKCRVILAGGLGPDNVAEAIRIVRPWGVDSFTKTSDRMPDGSTKKNPEKVHLFIKNAKEAAAELGL
ncbi:phosphoribosylanthranilate isomerase [Longilinea arvoryzae]|uniref:N-(5'-phosphoribosyl)anthranilate isomerase n=1 Tax=Longilinea arvoryzae TaxID=360412 RepID=A0A0S7BG43_9CHLR|nr:phosphoribosylanthranilate isomerase [Longilinea arvoryzae]GAP12410.1 phosphoribosylanthranilate isomerase [Longilinea arvoryzae]